MPKKRRKRRRLSEAKLRVLEHIYRYGGNDKTASYVMYRSGVAHNYYPYWWRHMVELARMGLVVLKKRKGLYITKKGIKVLKEAGVI